MSSVKPLTQEWMDIVLSKPSIASDVPTKLEKLRVAKADEMKLKIELDSREKEADSLKEQLRKVQERFKGVHNERTARETELKNLISESSRIGKQTWGLLRDVAKDSTGSASLPDQPGEHDSVVSVFADSETRLEAESLRKLQHVLVTTISRNSSRLSSMMSDRCDSEMERTRRIDNLLQVEHSMLKTELAKIKEVSKYVAQIAEMRRQYDSQSADNFRDLIELALAADSLEKDLQEKPKKRNHTKEQNASSSSRIMDLQARVNILREQVEAAQAAYTEESKQLQSDLVSMKVQKRNMKTKFQSDIKSIFADLDFLSGRIDRIESSLEKANVHYQLDEEEIVNIVSPIIEGIDGLRDQLEAISRDAEEIFYGN